MTDYVFDLDDEEFVMAVGVGGGGFAGVHNDLAGRSVADAHPISAITGLGDALAAKQDAAEMLAALAALTPSGTASAATFLRGDGAWAEPPSSGGGGAVELSAALGEQGTRDASAMNAGAGAALLDADLVLPGLQAHDLVTWMALLLLVNASGGARNYRPGVTLGSTSAQGQAAGQLSMTAATHLVVLEGSITVRSSDQVVEQRICSAGGSTSIGSMSTTAAEDVAEGVALNPLLWTNTSITTQTVQALSFKAWLWRS